MEETYKCGYCSWVLHANCANFLEHQCIHEIYKDGTHELVADEGMVLTVVEKSTGVIVGRNNTEVNNIGKSWEETFIKYVQDRPPLYDVSLPLGERTNLKKNQLWAQISNIYGGKFTPDELQKKWKYLRDCYIRAKKKVNTYKPSGSAAQPIPDPGFRHYEIMRFIDDHSSQQQLLTVSSPTTEAIKESSPSTSGVSSNTPLSSPTEMFTPASKRKKTDDKALEKGILEALSTASQGDGTDGFLQRLGASLRRIPYRERALLEIQILQLVFDTESRLNLNLD